MEQQLEAGVVPIKVTEAITPNNDRSFILNPDKNRQRTNMGEWYYQEEIDGKKYYWLVTTPNDHRLVKDRSVNFSEDQLKVEYIALRIYRELGLEVPQVKLINIKGKVCLAFKDLGNVRGLRDYEEKIKLADNEVVKTSFLAHLFLDNPYAEQTLVKRGDEIAWSDARGALGYWRNKTFREKDDDELHFGVQPPMPHEFSDSELFSRVKDEDMVLMARKIAHLDNERIADIVREAQLSREQTKRILRALLRRKEYISQHYARESALVPEDTPEWLALETKLEDSVGNRKLREASTNAQQELTRLEKFLTDKEKIDRNIKSLTQPTKFQTTETLPKQQGKFEEVVATLEQDLEKVVTAIRNFDRQKHNSADVLNYSVQLLDVQNRLFQLQRANPRILAVLTGKASQLDSIKGSVANQADDLKRIWSKYQGQIPVRLRQIIVEHTAGLAAGYYSNKSRPRVESYDLEIYALGEPKNWNYYPHEERQLVRYYAVPSKRQIQVLETIQKTLEALSRKYPHQLNLQEQQRMLGFLIEHAHNRRNSFKVKCEEIRSATASHVTTKELAKKILADGSIKSSLLQSTTEQTAYVNSLAGQKDLLPGIAFTVNGAEDVYGSSADESRAVVRPGKHYMKARKIVDILSARMNREGGDEVCFLAGNYPMIVSGQQFCELQNTQGGVAQELHVFDLKYSPDKPVGAEVKVDQLIFLCPEEDYQEWKTFLSRPKGEGGAGKEETWIGSHLKTYPADVSVAEWLRYLNGKKQLGLPDEAPGFFAATGNLMTQHGERTSLFTWLKS